VRASDEIRRLLLQGVPPAELVRRGYPKSTVYYVRRKLGREQNILGLVSTLYDGLTFTNALLRITVVTMAERLGLKDAAALWEAIYDVGADVFREECGREPPF